MARRRGHGRRRHNATAVDIEMCVGDIEIDLQCRRFSHRQTNFALQTVVECRAAIATRKRVAVLFLRFACARRIEVKAGVGEQAVVVVRARSLAESWRCALDAARTRMSLRKPCWAGSCFSR